MSGGSLNYAHYKIEEIAQMIRLRAETPLHRAFANHLMLVAQAAHDLEWVFSSDYGPGDEEEAIRKVITPAMELDAARESAEIVMKELQEVFDRCKP